MSHSCGTDFRGRVITAISEGFLTRNAAARLLFAPPHSPDFHPIEMAFSKLKALLRKAAARKITELWNVIADCLD